MVHGAARRERDWGDGSLMSEQAVFTAYVAGAEQAAAVTERLRELCEPYGVEADVTIVDVAAAPESAEAANIIGIPTVVLEQPRPRRRLIGQLDDSRRASVALGLDRFERGEKTG